MKKTDRLFRAAIESGSHATAYRVRAGEVFIKADWTRESGWYHLGFVEDCRNDLLHGEGGRIRDPFTAEAKAYRAAEGYAEPAPKKAPAPMTADEQAAFDSWFDQVQADRRKQITDERDRMAAMLAEGRAAVEARKNPAPAKPQPVKKSGHSFPF